MIRFQAMEPHAKPPANEHADDMGLDLYALQGTLVRPRLWAPVRTGVMISEAPKDAVILITPRSGLAMKHGISVLNSPGLIDPGYRGELVVILANHSETLFHVQEGDRIAQIVITTKFPGELAYQGFEEDPTTLEKERGTDGFGSTGR